MKQIATTKEINVSTPRVTKSSIEKVLKSHFKWRAEDARNEKYPKELRDHVRSGAYAINSAMHHANIITDDEYQANLSKL